MCHVNYEDRPDLIPNDLEAVYLEIKQANSKYFIFRVLYGPPNTTVETFSKIERLIQLVDNENKKVYMLVDLGPVVSKAFNLNGV